MSKQDGKLQQLEDKIKRGCDIARPDPIALPPAFCDRLYFLEQDIGHNMKKLIQKENLWLIP